MQLTQFTDYGLRSLMYLSAHPERLCSVREIAEHYGISRNHLVKIVHRLESLKLGDLILALEPNMHLVECFNRETNSCIFVSACTLKHYLADASKAFLDNLNQRTLADAAANKKVFLSQRGS